LPAVIAAGGLSNRAMANSMVDLPQPDSPTTPTNSPGPTVKSTASTAVTGPRSVSYSTVRSRTSSTGAVDTSPPHRPQRGVADLVKGIVDQGERDTEQGHTQPRRDRPERHTGLQGLLALRPIRHGTPPDRVRIAQAEELQSGRRQHRIE